MDTPVLVGAVARRRWDARRNDERASKQERQIAGWIDVVIPDAKTMIEQKSIGVDLDRPDVRQGAAVTPFEQAKRYADSLPNNQRPDFIIVCNFATFRIHDLNKVSPPMITWSSRLPSCQSSCICSIS